MTFADWKTAALAYGAEVYATDESCYDDDQLERLFRDGETPQDAIDWHARKYGLGKRADFTLEHAMFFMRRFGVTEIPRGETDV